MNLLMISGKGAVDTALGKKNAFYNTLEELHGYFERIDIVCPKIQNPNAKVQIFGNVFFHSKVPDQKFDVVTVHEYAPFRNGRIANRIWEKGKIPMMFEIMHIPGMPRAGTWKERLAAIMTRFYIKYDTRHASAVRVINSQVGDWLVKAGVPRHKIKLVSAMYIDLEIFKPMNLEKKYDLIFVGRRATNKGIKLFEEAVEKLKAISYKLKAIVVDGWAKDSQEVATLINESKILVMPSYNEGGPRVVLEALACNVPVLATPVGIVPDVLPKEWIIDWSAEDIVKKAQHILHNEPRTDLRAIAEPFEKKSAIKNYAEEIMKVINI